MPVPTPGNSCSQVLLAAYTSLGQSLSSPEPAAAVFSFLLSNITSNLTLHLEVMLSLRPVPSAIASTNKFLQASYIPVAQPFHYQLLSNVPSSGALGSLWLPAPALPNLHTSCMVGFRTGLQSTSHNSFCNKVLPVPQVCQACSNCSAALSCVVKNNLSCLSSHKSRLSLRPGSSDKFLEIRLPLKSPSLTLLLLEF